MKGFLITGTDTDVGKTWFMLRLAELLKEHKFKFHFLKPVESGCEEPNNDIIPKDATKFSFMLGIPTILGALVLLLIDIQKLDIAFNMTHLIVGFFVSMIFAFLTIKLFLAFVEKIGMIPFIVYRLLLGLFLLLII